MSYSDFFQKTVNCFSSSGELKSSADFLSCWSAELYTAVPSRPFFPRGFLCDKVSSLRNLFFSTQEMGFHPLCFRGSVTMDPTETKSGQSTKRESD
ncbi:Glycosyl hydrolase family 63, C-terminal [Dillenia turbinata]|uniref:Glycosyl hydrolase family 63, C-terminal n=1 Tax=Dillenia turbinata TaxID=194707 RepID=A0AAN8UHF5_9MAGN